MNWKEQYDWLKADYEIMVDAYMKLWRKYDELKTERDKEKIQSRLEQFQESE